jgi:hypothetical protein
MASTVVIITGMHRSGTSLVSSLLHFAGLNVGSNLLGEPESNPFGHYEDLDFSNLQDNFLTNRGYSYLQTPPFDIYLNREEVIQSRKLISQRKKFEHWGFKDPRTCLFLNHWLRLIPEAKFLFVFRHPLEVFISLLKRADYQILKNPMDGFEAWSEYNQRVLSFFKTHRDICTLCHIRAIIQFPEEFCEIISEKFKLTKKIKFNKVFDSNIFSIISIPEWYEEILNERFPKLISLYTELNDTADLPIDLSKKNTNTNEDILDAFGAMIRSMASKHLILYDELTELQREHHQTKAMLKDLKKSLPVKVAEFFKFMSVRRLFRKD